LPERGEERLLDVIKNTGHAGSGADLIRK